MTEALYYIGLSQALFVALVLLTKRDKQNSDYILAIWLISIAFKMGVLLISAEHGEFFDDQFSIALIPLTFGPFLFLYTKSLTYGTSSFRTKDYIHFIPFVALTIIYFTSFQGEVNFKGDNFLVADGDALVRIFYSLAFVISVAYYTYITFYILKRYRTQRFDRFSYFSAENELNWLYFLTTLFALIYAVYVVLGVINFISGEPRFSIDYISNIGLVLLTFSVSYFGLKQPYLFKNRKDEDEDEAEDVKEKVPKEKYRQSNLNDEVKKEHIATLMKYMEEERPFLNPELTVQDLSKHVNIARHHLTEILNNEIGKNFFTFINEYRIGEVKRRLLNEKFDHLTIIAIAYDCGFNSKSTFNSIFKQNTGSTPSKWKTAQLREQLD